MKLRLLLDSLMLTALIMAIVLLANIWFAVGLLEALR